MNLRQDMQRLFERAKDEASDVARTTRMKLDLRSLEKRRDEVFTLIGRRMYTKRGQPFEPSSVEHFFSEVSNIEAQIEAKRTELSEAEAAKAASKRGGGL